MQPIINTGYHKYNTNICFRRYRINQSYFRFFSLKLKYCYLWWWWTWQEAAMSRSVHHGIFSHLSFCCSFFFYILFFFFFFFFFSFFVFSVHIFPLEMYKNIKNEKLKVLQSVSIQLLCGVTPNCIQFFWMSLRWLTHIAITRLNSKKTFFFFFSSQLDAELWGHTPTHIWVRL